MKKAILMYDDGTDRIWRQPRDGRFVVWLGGFIHPHRHGELLQAHATRARGRQILNERRAS